MKIREEAKGFVGAILALMIEGVVIRMLWGTSPIRELLLFVGTLAAALVAAVFFCRIPWKRVEKVTDACWGIAGYGLLLALGAVTLLVMPYPAEGIVPTIGAVLPTLALLPLLHATEGRGTVGFLLVLAGIVGAVAVTWMLGFVAAAVVTGLVGAIVVLVRRRRFGEGNERWIGHLVFAGLIGAVFAALLLDELGSSSVSEWLTAVIDADASSFGESFMNYLSRTIWNNARWFGASTLREILVWENPQQYMTAEEVISGFLNGHLQLVAVTHRLGRGALCLMAGTMVTIPVNGLFLARAQQGFQRCVTVLVSLLLGIPMLFFLYQNLGVSLLMIDACPFFSGGFLRNLVYLLVAMLVLRGDGTPEVTQDAPARVRRAEEFPVDCRITHCRGDHAVIAQLKTTLKGRGQSAEQVEQAFAQVDAFTVLSLCGRYHDVRKMVQKLALDCPQVKLLALVIEYTENVLCPEEAELLRTLLWRDFPVRGVVRLSTTLGHSGDAAGDPKGTWRITATMGADGSLPPAETAQVDVAEAVS